MNNILLFDIGSTYTKVTVVDLDKELVVGTFSSFTTIHTDVSIGLNNAISKLPESIIKAGFKERFACSSAAGGLKMVTCGLVPSLTAEAAKRASLGAGAKVLKVFSYELTKDDLDEIEALEPDILLLTGGTDGGNSECILKNSGAIASISADFPVVIAGNRTVSVECGRIIEASGKEVHVCENVMPVFNELNITPVQDIIRQIFLNRIINAKGLSEICKTLSASIIPTPSAILNAMVLLADGVSGKGGIGELLAVDLGGATTDIYSIAEGAPQNVATVLRGLPEVYAKRTVEGDIGMRYSAKGIVDAVGIESISRIAGLSVEKAQEYLSLITSETDILPDNNELVAFDFALAALAIETAVSRHVGRLEQIFTPMGEAFLQTGKDLRDVKKVIATGGAIIHAENTDRILRYALYKDNEPMVLKPKNSEIYVDKKYILAAMGILSQKYPEAALTIIKKELVCSGT